VNWYLFAAYAVFILLIGGYVAYLARQLAGLRDQVDDLKKARRP
jgi:CcmD family protein